MNRPKRLFFCFIHIPKCGGLTFDYILVRNLGHGYLRVTHQLYEDALNSHNIGLFVQENDQRTGIGGHRVSLDLPEIEGLDIKAISFIRDPLDRIRSEFFYVKKLPGLVGQNPLIREMDYPSYLEYFLTHPEALGKLGRYQTNHLFGKVPYSEAYLLERVRQKKVLLFPLNRFNDACIYLEKTFPDYFNDTSFVKTNVNSHRNDTSYVEIEDNLREKLTKDSALFSLANYQFDLALSAEFSTSELLAAQRDFRRRCWIRKHTYHTRVISF